MDPGVLACEPQDGLVKRVRVIRFRFLLIHYIMATI